MASTARRPARIVLIGGSAYRYTAFQTMLAQSSSVLAGWHRPRELADWRPPEGDRYDAAIVDPTCGIAAPVGAIVTRLWHELSLSSVVMCPPGAEHRLAREVGGAPVILSPPLLPPELERDELVVALRSALLRKKASVPTRASTPADVFISYAHADNQAACSRARWLDRVLDQVGPAVRSGNVRCWSDLQLEPGREWDRDVHQAVANAHTAVLLLSAHYLKSRYILTEELPELVARAERNQCRIVPVVLYPCDWQEVPITLPGGRSSVKLGKYQAAARAQPLATLGNREQLAALKEIARLMLAPSMRPLRGSLQGASQPPQTS